jgi:peptidoglycan/xylan/chitin deacetylase (PgdA/CDA1 family)
MLTSAQIREMHGAGITIGAHTQTHSNMTLVTPEQARAEIAGSRERLEAILGTRVQDFAYPNTGGRYPHCNEAVAAIIRDLGFRSAVTSRPGIIAAGANPHMLPRIGISPRLYRTAPLAVTLERYRAFGASHA